VPAGYTAANIDDLIRAINAANQTAQADTITLAAGTSFTLTAADNYAYTDGVTGLPVIAATGGNLTIIGNGDAIERSTATGTPAFRLFDVAAGGSLTLQNLTLQGGLALGREFSGTLLATSEGGAVFNRGTLTLNRVIVQNNTAQGTEDLRTTLPGSPAAGGGVFSEGTLILEGSTILSNAAIGGNGGNGAVVNIWGIGPDPVPGGAGGSAYGGGVYIGGGTVSISNSVLTANTARGGDGGNGVNAKLYGRTFHTAGGDGGNGYGGGLYAAGGIITVLNSEVTQNSASGGQGGNGVQSPNGAPGQGIGGGLYIDPLAAVSLDAFTVNHTRRNKASTTDNDIYGSHTLIV
jgi:hypothetical protein